MKCNSSEIGFFLLWSRARLPLLCYSLLLTSFGIGRNPRIDELFLYEPFPWPWNISGCRLSWTNTVGVVTVFVVRFSLFKPPFFGFVGGVPCKVVAGRILQQTFCINLHLALQLQWTAYSARMGSGRILSPSFEEHTAAMQALIAFFSVTLELA